MLVLSSVCYCLLVPGTAKLLHCHLLRPRSWEPQAPPWEIGLRLLQPGLGWRGFVMLSGLILVMIIRLYESLIPLHVQQSNPHRRYFSGASARDITLSNLLPSFRSINSKCFCRLRFIRDWSGLAGTDRPDLSGVGGAVLIVLIDVTGRTNRNVYTTPASPLTPATSSSSSKCGAWREGGGGYIKLSGPLGRK